MPAPKEILIKNCLLLRHDKAGDALKSLAPVRALRKLLPSLELYVLTTHHNASLFEVEEGLRSIRLPSHWALLSDSVLLSCLAQQGLPGHFSSVVSLLCDPSAETDRLLKLFSADAKFARHVPLATDLPLPGSSPKGRDETTNIALLLGAAFGIDVLSEAQRTDRAPLLLPSDRFEAQTLMGEKNGKWVGFCPFAGLKNRSHPLHRWESFLPQATRAPGIAKFFLFGAPSDCRALERLRERCYDPSKVQICFASEFRTLGAYFLRLDAVVAVDSGPLHYARALGIPSLGILSGGDAKRWFHHLGPSDRLVRRGWFSRFPSATEMLWAFRHWRPLRNEAIS
jgi:hypothetical protein